MLSRGDFNFSLLLPLIMGNPYKIAVPLISTVVIILAFLFFGVFLFKKQEI